MPAADQLLERAHTFFSAEPARARDSLTARSLSDIRHFDLSGMQRVVAVCAWGSSGSLLLASYLDGHDDVIMLPAYTGCALYAFFDNYRSLPLRDKLLIYPFLDDGHFKFFFQGEHSVSGAEYLAAVNAACEVYGNAPAEFLESRRVFIRLLHVVHCVALGRLPARPDPLIVYQQHVPNEAQARYLVEDFADVRFIHTVRDPLTNCSRLFEQSFNVAGSRAAGNVIMVLTTQDAPHLNMESRTLAVRFEDMHLRVGETMGGVADWLGLPYRPSLLESTFSGRPWIARRGPMTWSGAQPAQAVRDCRNVSFTDRCLLSAVLYEDSAAWNYPCPKIFRHAPVRILTCLLLLLIPMRMEVTLVRGALTSRDMREVGKGLVRFCIGRMQIMLLLGVDLYRRLVFGTRVLPLRDSTAPAERAHACPRA
jgi:Sulfotransferase family